MSKTLIGTVVSTKMQKTVVVNVESKFRHPLYRKVIKTNKKFKAHNEIEGIEEGMMVMIRKVRPMSKEKHFMVMEKVEGVQQKTKTEKKDTKKVIAKPVKKIAKKTTKSSKKAKK